MTAVHAGWHEGIIWTIDEDGSAKMTAVHAKAHKGIVWIIDDDGWICKDDRCACLSGMKIYRKDINKIVRSFGNNG